MVNQSDISQADLAVAASPARKDAVKLPLLRTSFAYSAKKIAAHMSAYKDIPKVLDIGCGSKSDIGRYLKERNTPALIHGVDLDEYALKNQDVDQLFICDAAEMPFDDDTYDVVFSQFLLEHVESSEKTINAIARVMAKDGLATLIIPNPTSIEATVTRLTPYNFHIFFKQKVQLSDTASEDTFPTLFDFKSIKHLKKQMEAAGFKDVEAVFVPEVYFRFRFRPILVRLALLYSRILETLNIGALMDSVVMVGYKA
ncbi:MAG: class I SAM-dependent methyltransferase [Phormidesmis sp.]